MGTNEAKVPTTSRHAKQGRFSYGEQTYSYRVLTSTRKTLGIEVYPNCEIIVTAPLGLAIEDIGKRVERRKDWIVKQIDYFTRFALRTPPRQYVSGETHLYLGKQYRLKIEPAPYKKVTLKQGRIWIETDMPHPISVKALLNAWYRKRAHEYIPQYIEKHLPYFTKKGYEQPRVVFKTLTKRWASMSQGGVLTINPRLVQAPSYCIEYVIVHELCHLVVLGHTPEFFSLLTKLMPDWEKRKERLEMSLL